MSEFTSGVLFLKRDLESVNKASQNLMEKYVIQTLNDKWAALFSEQGNPREPIFAQWLASASKEVSLLCFEHAGDHGWGYLVFHDLRW